MIAYNIMLQVSEKLSSTTGRTLTSLSSALTQNAK